MKSVWLNNKNNNKLILFFNGWAMNETIIANLDCCDFDILMIYDYCDFDFNFDLINFENYKEKYLVCWSMGVYCANKFFDKLSSFTKKIAINGTNKMIDNKFGIPKRVYDLTIKLFDYDNMLKFIDNIFDSDNISFDTNTLRDIRDLKSELISIKNFKTDSEIEFDKVYISKNDKIVPFENQISYWGCFLKDNTKIIEIESAHFVFDKFDSWRDIVC